MNSFTKYQNNRCIIIDESGNLGSSGRYFVIAAIDTYNYKSLYNIMHTKIGLAKKIFPELTKLHIHEIKAKDAYPCIKYHLLECITKKELKISYIVADLYHVKPKLLADKNIFYNFMMKLLLDSIITTFKNGEHINILCDNKTTKVASANTFEEYIKLHFLYDKDFDIIFNVEYIDSDSRYAYPIQAADYIANAIYGYYEFNDSSYYNIFLKKIHKINTFPIKLFGK